MSRRNEQESFRNLSETQLASACGQKGALDLETREAVALAASCTLLHAFTFSPGLFSKNNQIEADL